MIQWTYQFFKKSGILYSTFWEYSSVSFESALKTQTSRWNKVSCLFYVWANGLVDVKWPTNEQFFFWNIENPICWLPKTHFIRNNLEVAITVICKKKYTRNHTLCTLEYIVNLYVNHTKSCFTFSNLRLNAISVLKSTLFMLLLLLRIHTHSHIHKI